MKDEIAAFGGSEPVNWTNTIAVQTDAERRERHRLGGGPAPGEVFGEDNSALRRAERLLSEAEKKLEEADPDKAEGLRRAVGLFGEIFRT